MKGTVKKMQVKNKKALSALSIIAGILLIVPMFRPYEAAAENNKKITLSCRQDDTILNGMEWTLYRVGERNGNKIKFIPELNNIFISLGDMSAERVNAAAKTIESYIVAADVAPTAIGTTDTQGELVFDGLDNGLYLARGKTTRVNEKYYVPSTLLIDVDGSDTDFSYDAYPKFYYATLSGEARVYTVKKVWVDDDDSYLKRPVDITVDLYKDGALNDTVTLSEENDWKYTWNTLDEMSEWLVVEREIPVHYEVIIDYNQTQYLIKNSYNPNLVVDGGDEKVTTTVPEATIPLVETTVTAVTTNVETTTPPPGTTEPPKSTSPSSTAPPPRTTVTTTSGKLAQTGQLWWPVLPLSLGGILLIGAGISLRGRKKNDEK